ncbi:glycosyltransferase family 61 protein [Aestuariibius sp. 2305UL40-4]|uniref:glycosyltransferase family 61 protein n=1 Tax=Aestuariibius violaceus TaxID=3234132 RepID=UPI00345E87AB
MTRIQFHAQAIVCSVPLNHPVEGLAAASADRYPSGTDLAAGGDRTAQPTRISMGQKPTFNQEDILRDEIVEVENALVVPPLKGLKNAPVQKSGVFDANASFVDASSLYRPNGRFNHPPDLPDASEILTLEGRYMYGGPMFGHFGHFLMDTMSRIWAIGHLRDKIDGVVFTPKTNTGNVEHVVTVQTPMIRAFGLDKPVHLITDPTRVDMLYVPTQGVGTGSGWEIASEAFREHMREYGGKTVAPDGPEKIYISRSELPVQRASYLSEKILESHLEAAGYAIIHPQKLPKEEQIARYRAARYVISPDGSPLHMLAYVGPKDQKVAIIARRGVEMNQIFQSQIEAFTGADAVTINCLRADWIPERARVPGRLSWGEVDMSKLYHELMANGFLPADTLPWPDIPQDAVAEELAKIEDAEGMKFRRFQDD